MLDDLSAPDEEAAGAVLARAATTLRPAGALRKLDEVAGWLAEWQRTTRPAVSNAVAAVFVADHGVSVEAVSAYPPAVTASMLAALRAGVATASVLARGVGVRLVVEDVGVGRPTGNLRREPALGETRFERSVGSGSELVRAERPDLLVLGEMGIGNTTAAAAVCAGLFGGPAEDWTGRGSGIDDDAFDRKVSVVVEAAERVEGQPPLEILRQVGGGGRASALHRRPLLWGARPSAPSGEAGQGAPPRPRAAARRGQRRAAGGTPDPAGRCGRHRGAHVRGVGARGVSGLPSAVAFLTRIPVGGSGRKPWDPAGALPWFPVVGALVGAVVAAVYALGSVVFPAEVAAAIAVAGGMALTGGLHEEGFADTFHGLGATSRGDALRILSDPAHGTYGLLALVVGTTVRVFALGSLRPVTALG